MEDGADLSDGANHSGHNGPSQIGMLEGEIARLGAENEALRAQLQNVGLEFLDARSRVEALESAQRDGPRDLQAEQLRSENEALRAQLQNVGLELLDTRARLEALEIAQRSGPLNPETEQLRSENHALSTQLQNVGLELLDTRARLEEFARDPEMVRLVGEIEALNAQLNNVGLELLDARSRTSTIARIRDAEAAFARENGVALQPSARAADLDLRDARTRLEFVFFDSGRAGMRPVLTFLKSCYPQTLPHYSRPFPARQQVDRHVLRWQLYWDSFAVPNSGQALISPRFIPPEHIGPTLRPIRLATMLREPLSRIASEYLAFRAQLEARDGAPEETVRIAGDILEFAETFKRHNALTRFFATVELSEPVDAEAAERARAALSKIDVVGTCDRGDDFARSLLALDIFDLPAPSRGSDALVQAMAAWHRGQGEAHVEQLDAGVREQLARANELDAALYEFARGLV